jgi:hypothetical protein
LLGEILEFFIRPVVELVFHVVLYYTARIVVPMVTLGFVRVESLSRDERYGKKRSSSAHTRGMIRVISAETGQFFALLFLLTLGFCVYLF